MNSLEEVLNNSVRPTDTADISQVTKTESRNKQNKVLKQWPRNKRLSETTKNTKNK